jgi:hypothetical protein
VTATTPKNLISKLADKDSFSACLDSDEVNSHLFLEMDSSISHVKKGTRSKNESLKNKDDTLNKMIGLAKIA